MIERCLEVFDYDLVVLGAPGGRRRFANVRKLQLFASAFEEVEGPDLGRFVAHLAGRTDLGAQEGSAAVLAEHEDVVRIMTVHKAKGLEFPVVVLAGLGKTGHKGSGSPFLVGRDGQVGFCLGRSLRHDCEQPFGLGPVVALLEEQRREEAEEEKRLVYVAVTRAEERAILTGVAGGESRPTTPWPACSRLSKTEAPWMIWTWWWSRSSCHRRRRSTVPSSTSRAGCPTLPTRLLHLRRS